MGTPCEPKPVKFFIAVLASEAALMPPLEGDLGALLGVIDGRSAPIAWTESKYYEAEMGASLVRGFLSFAALRSPAELAAWKLKTQEIEARFRRGDGGGRRVNLDPGYVDAFKVVLASTKNAGQRIYLGRGIYAEATLLYQSGRFHGMPYTYRDYLWPQTLAFLNRMRAVYLEQLRQSEVHSAG